LNVIICISIKHLWSITVKTLKKDSFRVKNMVNVIVFIEKTGA
jgi:hypothetical protein